MFPVHRKYQKVSEKNVKDENKDTCLKCLLYFFFVFDIIDISIDIIH